MKPTKDFIEVVKFEITFGFEEYEGDRWSDNAIDDLIEDLIVAGVDEVEIQDLFQQHLNQTVGRQAVVKVKEI